MQTLISLYIDHSKEAPCPEFAPLSQEVHKKWQEAISAGGRLLQRGQGCPVANSTPTAPSPGKIKKKITEEMQAFEDELSPCLGI